MTTMGVASANPSTPVAIVEKNNPLIKGVGKTSQKWNKRWADIDQPWPIEGTFDPEVIKTMEVLINTYEAGQKTGRKGQRRQEKRSMEAGILELFNREGQKLLKVTQSRRERAVDRSLETEKLMEKVNTPYSHMAPVTTPPPYEKQGTSAEIYPQLPILTSNGRYIMEDDDHNTLEMGEAKTTVVIQPDSKRKKKRMPNPEKKTINFAKTTLGKEKRRMGQKKVSKGYKLSSSDEDLCIGGYSHDIRRMLAKAEEKGRKVSRKKETDRSSTSESEDGSEDEDEESEHEEFFEPQIDHEARDGKRQEQLSSTQERRRKELKTFKDRLYKSFPVVVRGSHLEYKPWAHTDMSEIRDKLPVLQEGGHPWTSKLDEALIGTQPGMGDIKRLLANIVGVSTMEEILVKAGLQRYVDTAVHDPELFAANRGCLWQAIKDTYPTNVHPDSIIYEPMGETENPRAYVSRAYQQWRDVTGKNPETNQMEQAILRDKLQQGLPLSVRSKLTEVVGLRSSMQTF